MQGMSVCTFQGRRMPLKKSGIHMGNTTASLSSFLASSRSAMSSLQYNKEISQRHCRNLSCAQPMKCYVSVRAAVPVHIRVTGHNISLQWVHQVAVISCAIKQLLPFVPLPISPFLSLTREKKEGKIKQKPDVFGAYSFLIYPSVYSNHKSTVVWPSHLWILCLGRLWFPAGLL